jgi:hypothetical protein
MDWKKFITWISIIGSIASLIGLIYVFYPKHKESMKLEFS